MTNLRNSGPACIAEVLMGSAKDDRWFARANRMVEMQKTHYQGVHAHAVRMGDNAVRLAKDVGIPEDRHELIRAACVLHDIGKIAIPAEILDKKDKLLPEERREIEKHADYSAMLLDTPDTPKMVRDIAKYHHERYDGLGYCGLKGEEIPFAARIAAIADVHEALTAKRAYKPALPEATAIAMMISGDEPPKLGRTAFDPFLLRRFVGMRLRDPALEAAPAERAEFWKFASSEPMDDFGPKGHPDGFEIRKSGIRMQFAEGDAGHKVLKSLTRPNGEVLSEFPRQQQLMAEQASAELQPAMR